MPGARRRGQRSAPGVELRGARGRAPSGAPGLRRAWAVGKKGELEPAGARGKAHRDRVTGLAAAGGFLYSVSYDGTVKMWDAASLELVMEERGAHAGGRLHCAAAAADGHLYTGGDDKARAASRTLAVFLASVFAAAAITTAFRALCGMQGSAVCGCVGRGSAELHRAPCERPAVSAGSAGPPALCARGAQGGRLMSHAALH